MFAIVLASCGSMWNLNGAPQLNCAVAEEADIYWGRKYISCWNNRFLRVQIYIYIYIYIYDSEQPVVNSPMEHLHFSDQQG